MIQSDPDWLRFVNDPCSAPAAGISLPWQDFAAAATSPTGDPDPISAAIASASSPGTEAVRFAAAPPECAFITAQPYNNDEQLLIAVCRACHARLHRRHRLPGWAPPLLVALWEEQHPDWPLQLQLGWRS